MSRLPWLVGLDLREAASRLEAAGRSWRAVPYRDPKGVPGADSVRVVRVLEAPDGAVNLLTSEFRTSASQG